MTDAPTVPYSLLSDESTPEIPDFELVRPIGQGGFGRVWMARNRATGQWRAVKIIPRTRMNQPDLAGREVVAVTLLDENVRHQHPNLLAVHHVGQTPDYLFLVMDLADDVAGRTISDCAAYEPASLQRRLNDGPLDSSRCLACTTELLSALALLHQTGMVHRDVKPANCLFVGGMLKLADFGLLTQQSVNVSRVGTQKYMPPDGRMDARADVYAAGLLIYEMITGSSVESFPQLGSRSGAIVGDPILSALLRLVLQACQPDPDARFRHAGEMLAEVETELSRSRPRWRWLRVAGVVAAVAIVAAMAVAATHWRTPAPPAATLATAPASAPALASVSVNFITDPFDATILLDGKELCAADGTTLKTPCTVENLPAVAHRVVFRLPQRPDVDAGIVDFGATRQVVAHWEASSPLRGPVDGPDVPPARNAKDR